MITTKGDTYWKPWFKCVLNEDGYKNNVCPIIYRDLIKVVSQILYLMWFSYKIYLVKNLHKVYLTFKTNSLIFNYFYLFISTFSV